MARKLEILSPAVQTGKKRKKVKIKGSLVQCMVWS